MKIQLNTTINDLAVSVEIEQDARLLDVLRDDLGLLGTKEGCGVGECGACTVIINGKTANSCITLAASMEDCDIKTIEYLTKDGELHPMQESFIDNSALQCGFCTPGFVLSGISLLERNPKATTEEIKEGLSGNICRCTGYEQIIKAVEDVRDKKYNKDGASNE